MYKHENTRFSMTFEEGMVAFADGTVMTFVGDEHKVNMNDTNGRSKVGSTSTHNHPVTQDNIQNGFQNNVIFSKNDIQSFLANYEKEMRMNTYDTVSSKNMVLRLRTTGKQTADDRWNFFQDMKKAYATFKRNDTLAYKNSNGNRKEYAKGYNKGVWKLDSKLQELTKKYNYEYIREYL